MSIKLSKVMNTVKHSSPQSIHNKLLTSHNELRFNIDLQPGPIVGAHCPFLEPTLSQKSLPLQPSIMHARYCPSRCNLPLHRPFHHQNRGLTIQHIEK